MPYRVTDTIIVDQSRNLGSIGVATFAGPVLIGGGSSTGTVSQPLQVTGTNGAYVGGNLGIGSTNPSSKLSVIGDATFSGIVTSAVINARKDPGTGIATDFTNSVFGNGWRLSAPGSTTYYRLATLPAGGGGNTFDHLRIQGVLGAWTNDNQTPFDIIFSNRGTFDYKYISYGSVRSDVRIVGISTNGAVEIWAQHQASAFTKLVYNITESIQAIVVSNPTSTTTAPVGTTVFDSSTVTPRFIINESDNIGIGTITPTSKLVVQGDVSIASTLGIGTVIDIIPYDTLNSGTLSFEGSAGQLFSITNNLTTGSIFSVNDVSGIPSIDVNADGTIQLGAYGGNIGVGTTSATSKLSVVGNVNVVGTVTATTLDSSGINATGIITAAQLDLRANATANDSVLQISGTPSGASSTNGLLGIGTLNFSDTDIVADFTHNVNSYAQVILQNKNSGSTASADFIVNNDRTGGASYYGDFGVNSTTFSGSGPFNDPDGVYVISSNGSLTVGSITLNPFKIATNNVERLRVTDTGNVGINTTSPQNKLHVVSTANFIQYPLRLENSGTSGITLGAALRFDVYNGTSIAYLGGVLASASTWNYGTYSPNQITLVSSGSGGVRLAAANAAIVFHTGSSDPDFSSERVRITSTGNVGIGTTNPAYLLQVQGNARITGAVYDSSNSPGTSGQVLQSTVTGTQWTTAAAGGGGSGKFDTSIDNVLYIQPTGTLDIVGVGTTVTQITTFPGGTTEYIIHSIHVTNVSNGDAEITAGFIINNRQVPASISVSVGNSGGAGIHTFTVGSGTSIRVGMAVTGTGNIGETTGIGSTAGFQYNTYVTSVDGNLITLSKPMSGIATGTLRFSPVSIVVSRLPVPVGSAVELLKQPMILYGSDSIVLQSTGAGTGIGSISTNAVSQTANSAILTVTAGAAITNFVQSGMLVQATGINTGIQTNTYVGAGYNPGSLSIPITKPALTSVANTSISFTDIVVPQDGALQTTIVYQSTTDTSYLNGTGTVVGIVTLASQAVSGITSTVPNVYYGTGNSFPSTIQSIRVSNISDASIYPAGDYPVWVGIGNSDTVFSWLAYNMVIPRNSSIELCEAPKRLGIGQSIFAYSNTPGVIEIQIAGKQKTS